MSSRRRAFTLIELLVVVAVIALLLSILLPTLSRAQEQARVTKCLSNMRSIAQASASYLNNNDNLVFTWPLFYKRDQGRRYGIYSEFIWGGGVPDKNADEWALEQGDVNPVDHGAFEGGVGADVYWFYPEERPLNRHLAPAWADNTRSKATPEQNINRLTVPMDLPDVFVCPSDKSAAVPYSGAETDENTDLRTWEFWGNSYAINWHWSLYYRNPSDEVFGILAGDVRDGTTGRGAEMLAKKHQRGAAEFVLFFENRLNQALEHARPHGAEYGHWEYEGWHGQMNQHTAAFLDGHAAYRVFDPHFIEGAGWTVWPSRPWTDAAQRWRDYEDN